VEKEKSNVVEDNMKTTNSTSDAKLLTRVTTRELGSGMKKES
jgi:hypothetical protein